GGVGSPGCQYSTRGCCPAAAGSACERGSDELVGADPKSRLAAVGRQSSLSGEYPESWPGAGDPQSWPGAGDPQSWSGAGGPQSWPGAGDPQSWPGAGDPQSWPGAGDPQSWPGAGDPQSWPGADAAQSCCAWRDCAGAGGIGVDGSLVPWPNQENSDVGSADGSPATAS